MVSFSSLFRSNTRCRAVYRLLTVLVVTALLGIVAGCDTNGPADPIAVAGTWTLVGFDWDEDGNDNVERWRIDNNTIVYDSSLDGSTFTTTYRADVVLYNNGSLNAGDTALIDGRAETGNPGYAVIRYKEVNNAGTGEVDKYGVFRWADNAGDPAKKDFTQGYEDATPDDATDYTNAVFDTAAEAERGMTNAAGYFGFASTGVERQQ